MDRAVKRTNGSLSVLNERDRVADRSKRFVAPGQYSGHMIRRMTATEAKARILALLDEIAAGDEVEITKYGRVVARLVPATPPHSLKGKFAGMAVSAADDEKLFTTGAAWNVSRARSCPTRTLFNVLGPSQTANNQRSQVARPSPSSSSRRVVASRG
jgi:prevent-host-death family protein